MAKQYVTKSGAVSIQLYPPNLLCVTYHKIMADRAAIDEYFPVMEEWGLAMSNLLMFQDLREGDDMSLDNRLYMGKRYDKTLIRDHSKAIAFVTGKTYQRVILAGILAFSPPPAPYVTTTVEADAIRFLLSNLSK